MFPKLSFLDFMMGYAERGGVSSSILLIFRKAGITTATVMAAAIKSAIGPANITPLMPIAIGRKIIRGSKKMICRVRDRKVPMPARPMAVKKLDEIGCKALRKVQNR